MDEKDYELLHALDETRNITHAADKLYMTQSALSKRIKALEQEPVSYTHLRAHETDSYLVCRLLLEKKKEQRHLL